MRVGALIVRAPEERDTQDKNTESQNILREDYAQRKLYSEYP